MTLPSWVPGTERKPAPGALLLVQSFVNTRDLDLKTDLLADAQTANAWLHEAGLLSPGTTAGPDELRTARDAREGIRALIAHDDGVGELTDEDLRPFEVVTRQSRPKLSFGVDGHVQLDADPGSKLADGLLRLLLIIRDSQQDGTWRRLKVCGNPDCRWAFYDRSHSHQGAWCNMASCGNLIKNRNLRARRTGRAGSAAVAHSAGAGQAGREPS